MNVAVMTTKAEAALAEQFEAAADTLPGTEAVAKARRDAFARFATSGLPGRRVEEWKYTDLKSLWKAPLQPVASAKASTVTESDIATALGEGLANLSGARLVFVDGRFVSELSRLDEGHGKTYHVSALSEAITSDSHDWMHARLAEDGRLLPGAVFALNTAFMTDGFVMRIVEDASIETPIHMVFAVTGKEPAGRVTTRNFLRIGKGARATIVESHVVLGDAASEVNTALELHVESGAEARHIKLLPGNGKNLHLGAMHVDIEGDANLHAFQFTASTQLARNDVTVRYAGENSHLDLSGVFLARDSEHIDTTFVIDHAVPHCVSRELFKGVLDDTARGVFQGKVIVRPDAQKIDGKQMAQVLMLSPDTEFDSKPELEIYADDVICGHGTTSAEIDDDLLFYCKSRGIPEAEARALLIDSFIGEAIDKITHDGLRAAVMDAASAWLRASVK